MTPSFTGDPGIKYFSIVLGLVTSLLGGDYWQQAVSYEMQVRLEPDAHRLQAHSNIVYSNQSPDTLQQIYMHLYPRAFQKGSVKHREYLQASGRLSRLATGFGPDLDRYFWNLEISRFTINYSNGDSSSTYRIDDTILSTDLSRPLAPGDSLEISLDWSLEVGEMFERAGFLDEQFNMAQWYPKLVVYDQRGWHPDPFHAEGEFYGEFGTFDVTLDLPLKYAVGATGIVREGDPGWDSIRVDTSLSFKDWLEIRKRQTAIRDSSARRRVRFHAENVHDFAWVASPDFCYEHRVWNGTDIHVLFNAKNGKEWSKTVARRTVRALDWLSRQFGLYPYPQVTVTDRLRGGGMEYPMLVMNGRASEGLILHEIGHIWFYGILANNEVDEAWLDEGFTTFQTRWYLTDTYPPYGLDFDGDRFQAYQKKFWQFNSRTHTEQWNTIRFMTSGFDEPISRPAYLFNSGRAYTYNAYTKPAIMLDELRYLLGDSLFRVIMHTYFERWKFRHVTEQNFTDVAEEVSGQELDWFFKAWLHDNQVLDYELKDWDSRRQADGTYQVALELEQTGQRTMPIEIETRLQDGSTSRRRWENHLWRYQDTIRYTVPDRPVLVRLDPDCRLVDLDFRNNTRKSFAFSNSQPCKPVFRWPDMDYEPRDKYLLEISPLLYYHVLDGLTPGLWLTRSYGPWEKTDLTLNYAVQSSRIYWSLGGWRVPVRIPRRNRYSFHVYDQGGVAGGHLAFTHSWSRQYQQSPYHDITFGIFVTNVRDTTRTNLYERGKLSLLSSSYRLRFRRYFQVDLNLATTLDGFSDWSFSRLTAAGYITVPKGKLRLRDRITGGVIWSGQEGVPGQERYTIEGAGAGDLYPHAWLRDRSSMFGLEALREHYHMPGDANLRGYVGAGYAGTEKILANSLELVYESGLKAATLECAVFTDAGTFWGSEWVQQDNGFRGDILVDAGFGIRIQKKYFGYPLRLRIDFPVWVNRPIPGQTEFDFTRWIFSFQTDLN